MYRKKILVPVDFHETSYAAFKYAREIALKTNAKISCLYVIEESGYITSGFISKEIQESIRREAESRYRLALSIKLQQFLGHIPHRFPDAGFCSCPTCSPKTVQSRLCAAHAAVFLNEVEPFHGNI